jgi:hypothetical protein
MNACIQQMRFFQPATRIVRSSVTMVLILASLLSCREQPIDQVSDHPPTQRLAATTKLYLGSTNNQQSFDTVLVNGLVYPVLASDSMRFRFDAQQRLIRYQLTQSFQSDTGKVTLVPTDNNYLYQQGYLHEGSIKFPLDSTQRRVLSYTKKGYSIINFDSIRHYSSEGILVSALQTSFNSDYPSVKYLLPNKKATLEAGNVIRLEVYDYFSGVLASETRFVYDKQHFAPLATFTFLGETSRHALLRKTVINYNADGVHTTEYTYTNQYDSQSRLIRQLEYEESKNSSYPGSYILTKYYY